jgi:hypothetical protein
MTTRVLIDRNTRVRGDQAYVGTGDFGGVPVPGARVEILEPETGLTGPARVTEVDKEHELVCLTVDWSQACGPVPQAEPPSWLPRLLALLDKAVEVAGQSAGGFRRSARRPRSRNLSERLEDAEDAAADTRHELGQQTADGGAGDARRS